MPVTTTFAGHLIDGEVWGDHFSHEQPRSDEKGTDIEKAKSILIDNFYRLRIQF